MLTTKLYLDSRRAKSPEQECSVRVNISKGGQTAVIPANIKVAVKFWDFTNGSVSSQHPLANLLNIMLTRRKLDIDTIILQLEQSEGSADMTAKEIRDYILAELKLRENLGQLKEKRTRVKAIKPEDDPRNLKRLFEDYKATRVTHGTREKYTSAWVRISQWLERSGKAGCSNRFLADQITLKWLEDFEVFLRETNPSADSRGIHLRSLKTVLNYAVRHDIITGHPFSKFTIPKNKVPKKRNLGIEALRRIILFQGLPEHLEKYRDFFALSFMFRGLNTVDLCHLTKPVNGQIEWIRTKTGQPLTLTLEPEIIEIAERYAGVERLFCFAEGRNYRSFNNQLSQAMHKIRKFMNEKMAERGEKYVIPYFTMYYARHTWASIASYLDIPMDTIGVGLAHSQKSVTDLYIERDPRKIQKANRKVLDYVLYGIDPNEE